MTDGREWHRLVLDDYRFIVHPQYRHLLRNGKPGRERDMEYSRRVCVVEGEYREWFGCGGKVG
jgi:hypothetical protein